MEVRKDDAQRRDDECRLVCSTQYTVRSSSDGNEDAQIRHDVIRNYYETGSHGRISPATDEFKTLETHLNHQVLSTEY